MGVLAVLMSVLTSCREDEKLARYAISPEGTEPVSFSYKLPAGATRAMEGVKTDFIDGDLIHIEGNFTDGNGGSVTGYGCMEMVKGKFVPVEGSTLVWPDAATQGSFKAYYISGSTGLISPDGATAVTQLSELKNDTDPLKAESDNYAWGHTVELQFSHACTYLRLINMDVGVDDRYHLMKENGIGSLATSFQLKRNTDNRLELEFISIPNPSSGQIFITRQAEIVNNEGLLTAEVGFFLEPGDYSTFDLRTSDNLPYLSFSNNDLQALEANYPYYLDIKKSQGVTITLEDEEDWAENEPYWEVNVPEFMEAVVNGTEYSENGEVIIEPTPNGTRLMHNVNFDFNDYKDIDFEVSLPTGRVFDGGHHYIKNLGQPLFRYNYGTIQNVGLQNIKTSVVLEEWNEQVDGKPDNSRQGGICGFNRAGATIQNVRVEDVDITGKIKTDNSQKSHNLGALVGSNVGTMIDISIYGTYKVTSENDQETASMGIVYVGGLVGQNVGVLSSVSTLEGKELKMTVTNKCDGTLGSYYVGGAVGFSSAAIDHIVLPSVTVDSSFSKGLVCETGGLVGRLYTDLNTAAGSFLSSSTVSGTVLGGNSFAASANAASYTGGIAGTVSLVTVEDCRSVCDVKGTSGTVQQDVVYGTGGAFGRIFQKIKIENITAYGKSLTGPDLYIGNFAGIIPAGETYDDYTPFNMLVNNIISGQMTGTSMN